MGFIQATAAGSMDNRGDRFLPGPFRLGENGQRNTRFHVNHHSVFCGFGYLDNRQLYGPISVGGNGGRM